MSHSIVLSDVSRSLARFLRKELLADGATAAWMDSDERISLDNVRRGVTMMLEIARRVAAK